MSNMNVDVRQSDEQRPQGEFHGSSWDEYGGRNVPTPAESEDSYVHTTPAGGSANVKDPHILLYKHEQSQRV